MRASSNLILKYINFSSLSEGAESITVLEGAQVAEKIAMLSIQISFPKRFSVTAETTITVVEFVGLLASSSFWPPQAVYSPNDVTELRPFGCSGVFQRLEARATGSLSEGTAISPYEFYKNVEFISTFPDIADLSSSPCWSGMFRGLVASTFGTTDVIGTFSTFNSSITVSVVDDPVNRETAMRGVGVGCSAVNRETSNCRPRLEGRAG